MIGLRRALTRDMRTSLMLIDDPLDFLGMHLQPADIDDAGAPALEEAAVALLLDHVVRVDKTFVVEQFQIVATDIGGRGPFGADMQRAVAQAQLDFAIGVRATPPEIPRARRRPRNRRPPRSRRRHGR